MKAAAIIIIIALVLGGCAMKPKSLGAVEVRDYQGEKLDSAFSLRENSIKGPQHIDIENYTLKVGGLVEAPKEYSYDEVLKHKAYTKVIRLYCVEGWDANLLWEGVLLSGLIDEAKAKKEANTVIFHAYDGYTSSLPLDYIKSRNILLAYKVNNITLPDERGFPFEVIAEDKLGYKWVRWVTEIELSDNPDYKGTWESKGYSNKADV
ncbi:MAG TPA: molybdopterin-dependent oxidoreductase [Nanoarchaeota archaeon]|nr:molybdopterin-dependent oxidoreductase [Nanoarchaeota archaeon]